MAVYKTDLRDIYFNLFEYLKVQDHVDDLEESDLKDIIREFDKFVENEIFPVRILGDAQGVKVENGIVKVPECFQKAKKAYYENGWFGLGQAEEVGGMPAPISIYMVKQSLSVGANVAFMMYPGLTKAALNCVLEVGSEEQKQKYVAPIMDGTWGGTMCLTEAGAGSDVGASATTAKPNERGSYQINGVKVFISSGDNNLYENIIHLVLGRTPGAPEGIKGLSLFIVPKIKINEDGSLGRPNDVDCTKVEEKMGIHGQATCELTFGANGGCEGELIGNEFEGIKNMFLMMNEARLICGVQGEAQANLALQLTTQYAEERVQFGKTIDQHPDIMRMILKMRAISRGMRSLILYTGHLFDLAKKDPSVEKEIALLTPICKAYCTDRGFDVSVDAIQIHGGYGYCSEYGIEQFARDAKIATIYEGTNGIQAIDFVMRKILRDGGEAFKNIATKITKTLSDPRLKEWPSELGQMGESLQKGQSVLEFYGAKAQAGEHQVILESCTDFLRFSGNLILSWLLCEEALLSLEKLTSAEGDDKKYYTSKIDDFKIFCQHYLTENTAISQTILNFNNPLTNMEL